MTALVIRGGHLIDPAGGVDPLKDILLKDGRVAEIAGPGKLKHAEALKFSTPPASPSLPASSTCTSICASPARATRRPRIGGQAVDYYNLTTASFGYQIGAQRKDVVLIFMDETALKKFRNSDNWQAGVDGTVTVMNMAPRVR